MTDPDWEALGRRWWTHVQVLADDKMEGRETGTRGFEKAADYVIEQFRAVGLQPAGVVGYRQPIDFRVTQIDQAHSTVDLIRAGQVQPTELGDQTAIIVTSQTVEKLEAEAVFVGYGLTVPELGYDDLAAHDLTGRIAVFVRGGPADMDGPIKAHYQSPDERARALRRAGAIGAMAIPNPTVPELPWSRIVIGLRMPRMELSEPGDEVARPLPISLLFNPDRAELLFAGSGHSFKEITAKLGSAGPLPTFPLRLSIRARVALTRRDARCQNVAGILSGSDPDLRNEYVVVTAHLDHLGIGEPVKGDPIYSGALDNASGVATMLEVARSIRDSGAKPKRSILFVAVTGEEKGLLGSQFFANHPTVTGPMVANINIDGCLPIFPLKRLEIMGLDESTLGDDIRAVGPQYGVEIDAEYKPDRVLFIRSDQYSFIKVGVPGLFPCVGGVPGSPEDGLLQAWLSERYHGPADDLDQPIDLAAAGKFDKVFEQLVVRVANAERRPSWKPNSFFRRFVS